MLGRISEHKEHLVLNVELFKELCLDSECFYQEALPPWAMGQDEYSINIKLSELDLKMASEYLQKQLEIYPQRARK